MRDLRIRIYELPARTSGLDDESIAKVFGGECVPVGGVCDECHPCCTGAWCTRGRLGGRCWENTDAV